MLISASTLVLVAPTLRDTGEQRSVRPPSLKKTSRKITLTQPLLNIFGGFQILKVRPVQPDQGSQEPIPLQSSLEI
jgi:hypothetical protein